MCMSAMPGCQQLVELNSGRSWETLGSWKRVINVLVIVAQTIVEVCELSR